MGFTARHLLAAAAASAVFAAPATPAQAAAPKVRWVGTKAQVYTRADRPVTSIRRVVIHTTEGSFWGSVKWLQSGRVKASAHYVVSQQGEIVQLVRDSDIAWHAGNYLVNRDSIGIEHAGYANVRGSITEAEYRSSAQLSAWIARRSLMPIDRSHFIGHVDVPDPNNPKARGGFSHHHDPGPYWEWGRYLSYVKSYARGAQPPKYVGATPAAPKPTVPKQPVLRAGPAPSRQTGLTLRVNATTLKTNAVVSGFVRWAVDVGGKVSRVDFLVDGRVRWTEKTAPFVFGGDKGRWDTTREANGTHVLTLRVVGAGGKVAGSSTKVRVANMPFQVVSKGLANGEIVSSTVHWEATGTGGTPDRVEFLVDGRVAHSEDDVPFAFDWDTTKFANGPHSLTLRGVAEDGRIATTTLGVVVANETSPAPKPEDFAIVSQSLRDSQTVSGAVKWQVDVRGKIDRVEFTVDGVLRWTEKTAPYVFNGDEGRFDGAQETPGAHTLAVRAYARDGRSVAAAITVFVASGAPRDGGGRGTTSLRASSSLRDGEKVTGAVRWEAQAEGGNVKRVEFWVDGKLRHTETSPPYVFGGDDAKWDTARETNGDHKLVIRVVATDGSVSESVGTVSVFNEPAPIAVAIGGVTDGATVKGRLHVDANVKGPIDRVEFTVTRVVRRTDTSAPFEFDWDTSRDTDGPHAITVRAITRDGRETTATLEVVVANTPPLTVSLPTFAAPVKGTVHVEAKVGGTPDRVEFSVDGKLRQTERTAPYEFDWDTKGDADGTHVLSVRAIAGSRTADAQAQVRVTNAAPSPPPPPPPVLPLAVTLPRLTAPLKGTVHVEAKVDGAPERVEFVVDGKLRHTELTAPYEFDWDTKADADGTHKLTVRAVAGTRTAEASTDTTVRNAAEAPKPVVTLTGLSATAKGVVHVVAKVDNGTPERVEFLVDGTVRHTELTAPYEFDWDTKADKDGSHTLIARAVIGETRVEAQATVGVANAVVTPPPPTPTPPPPPSPPPPAPPAAEFAVAASGLVDGQTVSGNVSFAAEVTGDARRVELWIDGRRRVTDRDAPYEFTWNARREAAGKHEIVLRAYARDGRVATATLTVTVG